jgi:peptide/nickel transport system permease protein
MLKYITHKVVYSFLVFNGIIAILFLLFNIIPVNSARMTMGQRTDALSVAQMEKEFRLDLPSWKRYLLYLNDISPISYHKNEANSHLFLDTKMYEVYLKADLGCCTIALKKPFLGTSYQNGKPVIQLIKSKLLSTFIMAIFATLFGAIIGILLGIWAALKKNTWIDNAILVIINLGISQPSYFSAMILLLVLVNMLGHITHLNFTGSLIELDDYGDKVFVWKNLIIPVLALGVRPISIISQLTRSTMLDVMGQDFIRTAKAKGLSQNKVIFKHTLRNVLTPVATSVTGWFASLLAGAMFVEEVLHCNGLGSLTVNALRSFDIPVVMGCVLYIAFVFVIVNILTDFLYAYLDPRVKVAGK